MRKKAGKGGGLQRVALLAGLLLLVVSLQFGFGVAGDIPALVGALLLGCGGTLLWLHFGLPFGRVWLLATILGLAVLASTVTLELLLHASFAGWFAPLFAASAAAGTAALKIHDRARCALCNRRLKMQAVVFRCPRCSMLVCDESCWSFEHRRCRMCLENRVPVLPMADSWWNRVTGPRSPNGRCQVCLASGEQADLRGCARCRRLQCRDCWDFSNGECTRCGEHLPELPEALSTVVAELES